MTSRPISLASTYTHTCTHTIGQLLWDRQLKPALEVPFTYNQNHHSIIKGCRVGCQGGTGPESVADSGCVMRTLAPLEGSVCCGCDEHIHTDYRSPVAKKGRHGHSLSEREGPNPCLDKLLLLFWVHYMRMVFIYYAHRRFTIGDYLLQVTKNVLITSKRRMLQIKGNMVELVTLHTWKV